MDRDKQYVCTRPKAIKTDYLSQRTIVYTQRTTAHLTIAYSMLPPDTSNASDTSVVTHGKSPNILTVDRLGLLTVKRNITNCGSVNSFLERKHVITGLHECGGFAKASLTFAFHDEISSPTVIMKSFGKV